MIELIEEACVEHGITLYVTNSDDGKDPVLTRITKREDLPLMLLSWDFDTEIDFDDNGFIVNPPSFMTVLLVTKSISADRLSYQSSATEMGNLFKTFIKTLYSKLVLTHNGVNKPISNCKYKNVPVYGAGKHSGVLATFTMRYNNVDNCG